MEKEYLTKEDIKELYLVYLATVSNKKSFTVNQVIEVFKNDSASWFKGLKTTLSEALHGFLSKQFVHDTSKIAEDASVTYIQRLRNSDNVWEYSIDLEDEKVKTEVIWKIDSLLALLELEYTIDSNHNIVERFVHNYEELYISPQKVINLWEWRDRTIGELFEEALTADQYSQLLSTLVD